MTSKERFTMSDEVLPQPVILDNGFCMGAMNVVSKLNGLSVENEILLDTIGDIREYAQEGNITMILIAIDQLKEIYHFGEK